ncbi:LOW QUALITY PROTEIN: reverse transcriptase [Phytophthora megakarya]|uniref:Reverse transcriptase n=1 Tax=Phytophthora megakarya TaxID=4795 RepID=A0A225W8Q2_9STRA|nr:LOW QUALITY PROTEIN: reverse transcriptase [Phytophthora megakarya]
MCVDYRLVSQLIKLSRYPLPLIDDLLTDFNAAAWFMGLDMASGFWGIQMTERAKLISTFVCPFGHFQWIRMPFGFKNPPLVYQSVINNCPWGIVQLPPEEDAKVDRDVLEFLELTVPDTGPTIENPQGEGGFRLPELMKEATAFRRNIRTPTHMGPVLGRSSYIDDIVHGAPAWDKLFEDLNALLFRLRYWNISVSLPKSEFSKQAIPYLSHEVCAEGITATPKIANSFQDLPFPSTMKGVQSFLGSLNYYNKFIEDLPVVAAVLYELDEDRIRTGHDLDKAKEAFEILKRKITSTLLVRHLACTKPFVIIPNATPWAAWRALNESELRYHIAEKEVLAILQVLEQFRPLIYDTNHNLYPVFDPEVAIEVKSADGRHLKWGLELSKWALELRRVQRDEDGLTAILGAGITPREHLDEVAENLIPAKGRIKTPPPISDSDFEGYVLSFDGATKVSTRQGSCGCILCRLPGWYVLSAYGFPLDGVTVNDAESHGLIKSLELAIDRGFRDVVVVGDSRIVIQQAQGLIGCHQPNLQPLKVKFASVRLIHVKRDYNQAADYLTTKTLAFGKAWVVEDTDKLMHLKFVSRIPEKIMKTP